MERTEERDEEWNLLNEVERESAACRSCARVVLEEGWEAWEGLAKDMVEWRWRGWGGGEEATTSLDFLDFVALRGLPRSSVLGQHGTLEMVVWMMRGNDERLEHFYTISSMHFPPSHDDCFALFCSSSTIVFAPVVPRPPPAK
jgi:hypothetical protein